MSFILMIRLFYIQIVKGSFFTQGAFSQKGNIIEKVRGGIFDRNGKSLTGTHSSTVAVISPNWLSVQEKELLVKNNILDSLDDNNIKKLDMVPESLDILNALINKTPGVFIFNKDVRYGPTALATHVVGFQGQTGIEKAFNSMLESETRHQYVINDGLGQPQPA